MSFLRFLGINSKTAKIARERLQIVVSHQRTADGGEPDFLPQLRQELLKVICRYVKVDETQINVQLQKRSDNCSVLELNVTVPSG